MNLLSSILEDRTRVDRKCWDIEAEIKKVSDVDVKKCAKKCAEQIWGYERRNYYEPLDEKTADTIKRNHLYPTLRLAGRYALLIKAAWWHIQVPGKSPNDAAFFMETEDFKILEENNRLHTLELETSRAENTRKDETIANLRAQLAHAKEDIALLEAKNQVLGMELKKANRIEKRQLE